LEEITDFYLKKGRSKDSTQVVELGLKLHPNSSILLLKKAVLYLEIGEAKRALRILDRLPEKDDTEANLVRSEVLLQLGRRDEAVLLLHQIMEEESFERSNLALDISGILIQASEHEEAAEFIREALKNDPSNMDLLFEMAYNYEQLNQTTDAIRIYNQILALDPYSSETWFNLGQFGHASKSACAVSKRTIPGGCGSLPGIWGADGVFTYGIGLHRGMLGKDRPV